MITFVDFNRKYQEGEMRGWCAPWGVDEYVWHTIGTSSIFEQYIIGGSGKPFRYRGSAKLLSLQGLYQISTKALMIVGTYEVDMT